MDYIPVTPFRRAMDAAQLQAPQKAPAPGASANKWQLLRDVTTARADLGVSDRDITVLQALLSFHPGADLVAGAAQLVVFPSNLSICERLNGMPGSTMRRHLAKLVEQGLIARRDSPNGKRYCRRGRGAPMPFGLDLSPLLARAETIAALAEATRQAEDTIAQTRLNISLMRRDLQALVAWGAIECPALPHWPRLQDLLLHSARHLRRRPVLQDLQDLQQLLLLALREVQTLLPKPQTEEMSTSECQNEQHHQNSDKEIYESESAMKQPHDAVTQPSETAPALKAEDKAAQTGPVPLGMVLATCTEVQSYAPEPIRSWPMLIALCDTLRPMIGITPETWHAAKTNLGPLQAATVLSAMFQKISAIRNPGAYLRRLCQKAEQGLLSPAAMLHALR